MPPTKRVSPNVDVRDEESDGQITTLADVSGGTAPLPEIEVDEVQVAIPPKVQPGPGRPPAPPMVVIRTNDTIEDMSWVHMGRVERYTFEAGKRYQVPIYIAQELEGLGKLWH